MNVWNNYSWFLILFAHGSYFALVNVHINQRVRLFGVNTLNVADVWPICDNYLIQSISTNEVSTTRADSHRCYFLLVPIWQSLCNLLILVRFRMLSLFLLFNFLQLWQLVYILYIQILDLPSLITNQEPINTLKPCCGNTW